MMIVGDSVITTLNGPVMFISLELEPRYQGILPTKYMIFLGDEHSYDNFKKCDIAGCVEAKLDFFDMLNDFGKRGVDIQVFSEEFKVTKQKITEQSLNYTDITRDLIMRDINAPGGLNTDRQLIRALNSRGVKRRSDMLDFNQIYFNCFVRSGRCKHNNIEWHYADVRKRSKTLKKLSHDNFELYCNMNEAFNLIIEYVNHSELQKKIDVLSIEDYVDSSDKPDHNVMTYINEISSDLPMYLDFLELMFNNRAEFVRRALASHTLNKQYNKLIQPLREIFTDDSFVQLLEYNIAYLNNGIGVDFDALLEKINILFGLLRRIHDVMKSKTKDAEKTETIRTILRETPLVFDKTEQLYIDNYYLNCGHIYMDIYFIFRSNKYRKNNLLTVSYFGSNHSKYIREYFVNIVKTHRLDYHVTDRSKRIPFTKEINLNEIMGLIPRRRILSSRRSASPSRSASPKALSKATLTRRSDLNKSLTKASSKKASAKALQKATSPIRMEYIESESKNELGKGSRKKRRKRTMKKQRAMRHRKHF
jgi:hypothetical protein